MAMSGISPIGAYSSMAAIKPIQYQVQNQSEVSDAYQESVGALGGAQSSRPVDAVSPVVYANAQKMATESVDTNDVAQKVSQAYNKIASSFSDKITGYSSHGSGEKYSMVGNSIDLFA